MAHKFPPWRRAILVPFWTLQLFLMLLIVGLLLAGSKLIRDSYDSSYDYSYGSVTDAQVDNAVKTAINIVVPVWCSLSGACALIVVVEIVILTRRKLTPLKFVILNSIKSAIWTGLCIMDIVSWANTTQKGETALGVVIELGIVLSFYLPLIYGSIVFHKQRKQKTSYNPLAPQGGAANTTYQSQVYPTHHDVESGPPPYHGQISGTTGGAYDPYKAPTYNNHGDLGLAQPSPGLTSPSVPQVYVQHHQGNVYEMDTRRTLT